MLKRWMKNVGVLWLYYIVITASIGGLFFLIKLKFEVKGQRCAMVGAGFYSLYFICDSFISFMISIFIHGINAVYIK